MTDKEWQIEVLQRHKLCEICGRLATVAHHLISKGASKKLRHELDNGAGLCHACYNLVHISAEYGKKLKEKKKDILIKLNKIRYGKIGIEIHKN